MRSNYSDPSSEMVRNPSWIAEIVAMRHTTMAA